MAMLKSLAAKRAVATASMCLFVLAAGGCGSSNSSSGRSGLSRSALLSRGNAICTRHHDVITAAAGKLLAGGNLPTPAKFGKLAFGTIIPQTTMEINELSALTPNAKLAGAYAGWLASLRAAVAKMKQNPVAIQHSSSFVAVNRQGGALGLSGCHVGPGG